MGNLDPLRHHRRNAHLQGAFGNDQFGAMAERVAKFLGTPRFIIIQTAIVLLWVFANAYFIAHVLTHHAFDPYPFILLNLAFSTQSAYAAPMILLAQTRQADRDKVTAEAVACHTQEEADRQIAMLEAIRKLTEHDDELTQLIHDHLLGRKPDGRPGSDPGLDSEPNSGERAAFPEHVSGVHGHDQPADAAGDPEAAGS